MEKRKPHFLLTEVQKAFGPDALNRTVTAARGADALGMNDAEVIAVVQALVASDFDKSMTALHDHKVWQDVYRPKVDGRELYVKFTTDAAGAYLLISFKEA